MLNHHIHLSQSYTGVYMLTDSMFYIEPLCVHLTGSISEGFVDHYGFMEEINKFKLKLKMLPSCGTWKYKIGGIGRFVSRIVNDSCLFLHKIW